MPTLASAFTQFLDHSSFAHRTRDSYTDDLAPLLTQYGQADVSVLTTEIIQAYLACQESLAPTTYNRRLATLRSLLKFLRAQRWQTRGGVSSFPLKMAQSRHRPFWAN